MFALMGIGGGNVQFLDIAFLIGTGMLFVTESVEAVFSLSNRASLSLLGVVWPLIRPSSSTSMAWRCLLPAVLNNGGVNDGGGCFLYF